MTNFLYMPNELFNKKRSSINKSKQKNNIQKISPTKATISNLSSFDEKQLPVLIPAIK